MTLVLNIGDSCAIIRANDVKNKIIAVEGVKRFYEILDKNSLILKNITVVKKFINTNRSENINLKLRILSDFNASVVYDEKLYKNEKNEVKNLEYKNLITLEDLINKFNCKNFKFLKTDIEGYDIPLLVSNINLIRKYQPIIFFECHVDEILEKVHKTNIFELLNSLKKINYQKISIWDEGGYFILNSDLNNLNYEISDILDRFKNKWGKSYLDICVYPIEDSDIADEVRKNEIKHFYDSYETYNSGDISHINFN